MNKPPSGKAGAVQQASPAPLRFHPKMAETYRDRVGILIRGLGKEAGLTETREALRGLIEKIVLEPRAEGEGFDIDLHGALAGLLRLATGVEQHAATGARKKSANANGPAGAGLEGVDSIEEIVLVAGTGFDLHRTEKALQMNSNGKKPCPNSMCK